MKYVEGSAAHLMAEAFGFNVGKDWRGERPKKRTGKRRPLPKAPRTRLPTLTETLCHKPMKDWVYPKGARFRFKHNPIRSWTTAEERRLIMLRYNPPGASEYVKMTPRAIARSLGVRTSHVLKVISRERHLG